MIEGKSVELLFKYLNSLLEQKQNPRKKIGFNQ
jgi:hypothetical protein